MSPLAAPRVIAEPVVRVAPLFPRLPSSKAGRALAEKELCDEVRRALNSYFYG